MAATGSEGPDTLRAAILTACGAEANQERHRATLWLNQFAATDAAWQAALVLLGADQDEQVRFFCANLMLTKTRSEWRRLPDDARGHLSRTVSSHVQEAVGRKDVSPLVSSRLCLLLAAITVQSGEESVEHYITGALNNVQAGKVAFCFLMLKSIAEEAESTGSDTSARHRSIVAVLSKHFVDIWVLIGQVLQQGDLARERSLSKVAMCLVVGIEIVLGALSCGHAWARFGNNWSGSGESAWTTTLGQLAMAKVLLSLQPVLTPLTALPLAMPLYLPQGACTGLLVLGTLDSHLLETNVCFVVGDVVPGLVRLLQCSEDRVVEAVADLLIDLIGTTSRSTQPRAEEAVVLTIMSGLHSCSGIVGGGSEDVVRRLAQVAVALAENQTGVAAGTSHEAIEMCEFMLGCMGRIERSIAEVALDYFLALNTVALAHRAAALQASVFARLLPHLLRHACYPTGFEGWETCVEEDEQRFDRFRDQILTEALETCYDRLHQDSAFLRFFHEALREATSWQLVEAGLFCLRAVAGGIMETIEGVSNSGTSTGSDVLRAIVHAFSAKEGTIGHRLGNQFVMTTAACLLGDFASWFSKQQDAPLEAALQFLLSDAMPVGHAQRCAADSFQKLCTRCGQKLGTVEIIHKLAQVVSSLPCSSRGQAGGLALSERIPLIEGLSRLAARLKSEGVALGIFLVEPLVAAIDTTAQKGAPPVPQSLVAALVEEVSLVGRVVRFMEGDPCPRHPAVAVLECAWPCLLRLVNSPLWSSNPEVMAAVCEVFKWSCLSAQGYVAPLLPAMLPHILTIFKVHRLEECLSVVGAAIETMDRSQDSSTNVLLAQMLEAVCSTVAPVFQGGDLSSHQELVHGVLKLADSYLLFAPDLLVPYPVFPTVLQWCVQTLGVAEREPLQAALSLLAHALGPTKKQTKQAESAQLAASVDACVSANGQCILERLVWSACDSCPRHMLKKVADILYDLVGSSEAAGAWLAQVLSDSRFLARHERALTKEDCEQFCTLVLRKPRLTRPRFGALVVDFVNIPRGEGTADALIGYEM